MSFCILSHGISTPLVRSAHQPPVLPYASERHRVVVWIREPDRNATGCRHLPCSGGPDGPPDSDWATAQFMAAKPSPSEQSDIVPDIEPENVGLHELAPAQEGLTDVGVGHVISGDAPVLSVVVYPNPPHVLPTVK